MPVVIAILALVVAAQYGVIGVYIVPRLARLADEPSAVIRAAQWGAAVFFVGCAVTHVGIGVHGLTGELVGSPGHLLLTHGWPHLGKIIAGATFIYIAWKKLDVRFSHKGFEEERAQAAALLAERAEQQHAVAQLGQQALHTADPAALIDKAVRLVARTLDAEFCKVLELEPSGDRLLIAAGVGWDDGIVGRATVAVDESTQAGFTLSRSEPVVVDDLRRDPRFAGHAVLHDHGVVSGVTVAIRCRQGTVGVLGVHTASQRRFTPDDINFLTSVTNVLASALDRAAGERQLHLQALHDELAGLSNNRTLFVDRLQHALSRRDRSRPEMMAVLLVDVDDFKAVNDSFGHEAGDLECGEVHVTASTGIALSCTANTASPDSLLRQADTAMRRAKTLVRWQHDGAGGSPLTVSVNVSGDQIARPELAVEVTEALQDSGLAAGTLALEITESVLMENAAAPREMLGALRAAGARLVLDDFGTGYSSLSHLRHFPLDAVKIDRSFIAGLDQGHDEDAAIIAAIVSLARRLGLDVVAEGVETAAQRDALRALDCGYAQGHLFARPLAAGLLHPAHAGAA